MVTPNEYANDGTADLASLPIGPGSLTWRLFGDRRFLLLIPRIGTLQNMHPAVGAGVIDHSNIFDNLWDRVYRSLPPIFGVVYDPPELQTGGVVREFHSDIKGFDLDGHRYHALNPDVFWWTHATFIEMTFAINELFDTPLTLAEKDQLVKEGVTWWRRYGLSDRPVIDNYADFETYWNRIIDEELQLNAATEFGLTITDQVVPAPPDVPDWLWRILRSPTLSFTAWLMNATLPPRMRERLGLTWSAHDERLFRAFATVVRYGWPLLPERLRYFDRAHRSIRHARNSPHETVK